ncbi:MAG: class I SAM-dependent methyltransferase [Nitrospirota bacterium]
MNQLGTQRGPALAEQEHAELPEAAPRVGGMIAPPSDDTLRWPLPAHDHWARPFAEALLHHLDLFPGAAVLDVACGRGIPAFYVAEQVGPAGEVLGIDLSEYKIACAREIQRQHLPWLRFECLDMRWLPSRVPTVDRITGNLSVLFFRPNRLETIRGLVDHLKPGGQLVLTFPSRGTFHLLWRRIDREMAARGLSAERRSLDEYVTERPSADDGRAWLHALGCERIEVTEWPLEIPTGPGPSFLRHPILRGGFLDDVYDCFDDPRVAEDVMKRVSHDIASFTPLMAQRCVLSGWKKGGK